MLKFLLLTIITYFAATSAYPSFYSDDGELQCQLTRHSPSMVVATMEDLSYEDVRNKPFEISLAAKDFGGFEYKLSSCFLQTNADGGSDEENVYEVSMKKPDHNHFSTSVGNTVTFHGISQFRPDSTLGQFKVYCPLVAPNLQLKNIPMSVTLTVGSKSFTQSSSECEFHPYKGFAKNIAIESALTNKDKFVVKITGLYQILHDKDNIYVGFVPVHSDTPTVTLGTTGDYYINDRIIDDCSLNGKNGLIIAWTSQYGIKLVLKTTLMNNQDYVISCPLITASIPSGIPSIPSIAYVSETTANKYSMATNIFF